MIYWFTGQPGAGKTTLALALQAELRNRGYSTVSLDGDAFRAITDNRDFSPEGRTKNVLFAQGVALHMRSWGIWVVASFVSPFRAMREEFKKNEGVLEIYVHTSEIRGREKYHSADYEPPQQNFLDIDTTNVSVESCVKRILDFKSIDRAN